MYRFLFAVFLFFILSFARAATVDSLQHALASAGTTANRALLLEKMAQYWTGREEPDSVNKYVRQTLSLSEKEDISFFSDRLSEANKMLLGMGDIESALQLDSLYLLQFKKKQDPIGIAACLHNSGRIRLLTGDIAEGGSMLLQAHKLSGADRKLKAAISIDLGEAYTLGGKYTDALQVLTDALSTTDSTGDTDTYCGLLLTLGNTYGQIKDFETTIPYYERVLEITGRSGNLMGKANALINLAASYSNLRQYDRAEPKAREALKIVAGKNPVAESEVLSILSDILLAQHKYGELPVCYERMRTLAAQTGNSLGGGLADMLEAQSTFHEKDYQRSVALLTRALPVLEAQGAWAETIPGYKLLSESYEQLGDYRQALAAAVKFHDYTDSVSNEDKVKELALLQSRLIFQKKELIFEKEQRVKNVVIFSLSVIFSLAILLAIFIFKNRQKLNSQKQMALSMQLERAEHGLRLAETKLNDFALRVQEKTRLIAEMEQQLLLNPTVDDTLVQQLREATILTSEDWERFRQLFEQVHAGFLKRITDKYPEVSKAEIRYLTLAKLGFSTKEMAAALGVSTQSIRTNWYRIRKKLELSEEVSVEQLVGSI